MSSPERNLSPERRVPYQRFRASDRWIVQGAKSAKLTAYQVKEYLARYPRMLENFLAENVSTDFLKNIIERKRSMPASTKPFLKQKHSLVKLTKSYSEIGLNRLCKKIITSSKDEEIFSHIYDLCQAVACAVNAHDFRLYMTSANGVDLAQFRPGEKSRMVGPIGFRLTVSAHVAAEKKAVNVTDLPQDYRFPKGTALGDDSVHQVMAVPILSEKDRCFGVAEFVRNWSLGPFSKFEFELTNAVLIWVNACIQKMKINKLLGIRNTINKFLLESIEMMVDELYDTERLVTNIFHFTKDLVSADRCSLLLVDHERKELYADYFDEGKVDKYGKTVLTKKPQIRFPMKQGIVGYVAKTGEIVNIKDAYKDERFNPDVDKQTGYNIRNILCMPISGKHRVVGVVQMINRLNGNFFTEEDEEAFRMFSVYCALSLHYTSMYNIIKQEQAKYKSGNCANNIGYGYKGKEGDYMTVFFEEKNPAAYASAQEVFSVLKEYL